ncbi:hypothetical protein FHX49_000986 [Microbacterium endophyticum]|uniref:DUF58 domain-containing protein n=1 Tax=Microbacterium endophyticum TaxID=1526412 RepID=A0A7W4V248_9MICO|nr:DUF58 domain-containing protein [Microbacterium endophyticum]MBB2975420.1 hypothetical protein [Microbacterium endophyticum]NIK35561.1 hypothetical protein [Microbacterium endophyticum]
MSPTEPRIARTSTSTSAHTGQTTRTQTSVRRGRRVVAAVVWTSTAWRAVRRAARIALVWSARTVRPAGAIVVATATVGLALGLLFGWVESIVAAVVALVLVALSVPFLFGARSYAVDLTLGHDRVTAGDSAGGEITVRAVGSRVVLPGRLDVPVGAGLVEVGVPLLRPGRSVAQPLDLPALRRGVVTVGPATTVRSDPIGLLRREHTFDDVHELFVHPRTVALPSTSAGLIRDLEGNPTRRLVDADMSFHAIREYAPGDSQRQIHWKSTAKTGRLMVRQYEESRRSRMAVVLAASRDEYLDADEYELAVACAASLGLRALRDARDLDIMTGSEIPRVVRGRIRALERVPVATPRAMLDGFSRVELHDTTMPVGDVVRFAVDAGDRLSVAFVVVGSTLSLTQLRRIALHFPADVAVFVIVCDERAHPRMQAISGLTVLTVGVVEDLAGLLLKGAGS